MIVPSHSLIDATAYHLYLIGAHTRGALSVHIESIFGRLARDMSWVVGSGSFRKETAASPKVESGVLTVPLYSQAV
jgi:hypothetical protein